MFFTPVPLSSSYPISFLPCTAKFSERECHPRLPTSSTPCGLMFTHVHPLKLLYLGQQLPPECQVSSQCSSCSSTLKHWLMSPPVLPGILAIPWLPRHCHHLSLTLTFMHSPSPSSWFSPTSSPLSVSHLQPSFHSRSGMAFYLVPLTWNLGVIPDFLSSPSGFPRPVDPPVHKKGPAGLSCYAPLPNTIISYIDCVCPLIVLSESGLSPPGSYLSPNRNSLPPFFFSSFLRFIY